MPSRTKTPDSEAEIALDANVLALLLRWKEVCPDSVEKWFFADLDTGGPFHARRTLRRYFYDELTTMIDPLMAHRLGELMARLKVELKLQSHQPDLHLVNTFSR